MIEELEEESLTPESRIEDEDDQEDGPDKTVPSILPATHGSLNPSPSASEFAYVFAGSLSLRNKG